jgi:hypothetical protein
VSRGRRRTCVPLRLPDGGVALVHGDFTEEEVRAYRQAAREAVTPQAQDASAPPGEKEPVSTDTAGAAAPLTFDRPDQLVRSAGFSREDSGRPLILPDPEWTPEQTEAWLGKRAKDGRVPYTRVTTFVEALLEGTALGRWKMRRVALGMGRRPDYVVAAAALTAEDRDKAALNDLAEKALEAAGPNAADIGTALHQFTERIDRGEPIEHIPDAYVRDLDAYREQVQRITWLHREEPMVCDLLECAGTPDGIGLVDEPDPDGVVGIPRIVDLKTGNVEYTAGKFSAQLGTYANSALYDLKTGARTLVPELDTRWGLVLHMPAGMGSAELRWLNLQHGWLGAQLSAPIRKWRTVTHGDLMRPLVKPEPRVVEPGKCAGRKRDGEPCTYKAVSGGMCGRHQDQVGTDPDAAVSTRTQAVADQLQDALQNVPEPLRVEQPATVVLEDDALESRLDAVQRGELAPERPASAGQQLEHAAGGRPHYFASSTPGDSFAGLCLNCGLKRDDPAAQHLAVTPSTAVDPAVDQESAGVVLPTTKLGSIPESGERCDVTDLLVEQCACPAHRPDLADTGDDGVAPDEPRELQLPAPVEQQGTPRPHSSLSTPEDATTAALRAEQALLQQVAACRTNGELTTLYQRTGFAWTPAVLEQARLVSSGLMAEQAQRERASAALLAAIRSADNGSELQKLWQDPRNQQLWTDEHTAAARERAAQVPPF